jgi:transporter family protein
MQSLTLSWQFWALLSATFAALTAIFTKVGGEAAKSDFPSFIHIVGRLPLR